MSGKKKLSISALFLLLLITSVVVFNTHFLKAAGVTRYVDGVLGNDSWTGNVANGDFLPTGCEDDGNTSDCTDGPWKTVAKVNATTLVAGDRILFKRGQTWAEQLTVANSGSAGSPIYFGAYGNSSDPKPIIDAGNTRSYSITFGALSYLTFEDIKVQDSTVRNIWSDGSGSNIILNNIDSERGLVGIWIRGKSNSSYTNITANHTTSSYGFYLSNPTSNVVADNITANSDKGSGISFGTITNLTATNLTAKHNTGVGVSFSGVTGTLTASNITAGASGGLGNTSYGITIQASTSLNFSLTNSTAVGNGDAGVFLNDLRNGTISGSVSNIVTESNASDGMRISYSQDITVDNVTSRNNTTMGNGFAMTISNNNLTFNNCSALNNAWDGFSFKGTGSNFVVNRAKSISNGTVGQGNSGDGYTSHDTVTNLKITNSIASSNKNSGLAFIGATSGYVYNSTFYNNGVTGFNRGGFWWEQVTGGSGWTLRNNIFSSNYPREITTDASASGNWNANYNLYYHLADNNFVTYDGGTTNDSWANYHSTKEANSKYGDPLFVDAVNADFDIVQLSPAIDSALVDANTPTTDFLNRPRYDDLGVANTGQGSNTYTDIGAYEIQSSPPVNVETAVVTPSPVSNSGVTDNNDSGSVTDLQITKDKMDYSEGNLTFHFVDLPTGVEGMNLDLSSFDTSLHQLDSSKRFVKVFSINAVDQNGQALSGGFNVTLTISDNNIVSGDTVKYWDGSKWSEEGITNITSKNGSITFDTNHFSEFAVIRSMTAKPSAKKTTEGSVNWLIPVSIVVIGLSISIMIKLFSKKRY